MLFADMFTRNARFFRNKVAFVDDAESITFHGYNAHVNRLINGLENIGVTKGKIIGILGNNSVRYMEVCGIGEKGGRIVVPINTRFTQDDLAHVINDCEIDALFVDTPFIDLIAGISYKLKSVKYFINLRQVTKNNRWLDYDTLLNSSTDSEPEVEIDGEDILYIFYTSGTTGHPKGVMLSHYGQVQNVKNQTLELGIRPDDKMLCFQPFYHTGGKTYAMMHFIRGCTNVIMSRFDAIKALKLILSEKITTFICVPTMLNMLMEAESAQSEGFDLSSLRTICYSASSMPLPLLKRALLRFGPIFIQPYGLTESGPTATYLNKEDHVDIESPRLNSCGIPGLGVEVRVVNEQGIEVQEGNIGELLLKTETSMKGYFKNSIKTKETTLKGWLFTGDMIYLDEDHYIYIVGRQHDMIISGGENIYPKEIEDILQTHPNIEEVGVVGIPDDDWVEVPAAAVLLKANMMLTSEELIEFCKSKLARYKAPKKILFVDKLPKNATGKVVRVKVREMILAERHH